MTDHLTDQEIDLLAGAANSNDFVARSNALADVVERIVAARVAEAVEQERAALTKALTMMAGEMSAGAYLTLSSAVKEGFHD